MYLEIDEGFVTHRKTLRFCALMQSQNAFAFILRLWSWACRSSPDGDLAGMEAADIEFAVQYTHADGKCYGALVKAGFIDADEGGQPARIHNWAIRTGAAIEKMADEAKRKKVWRDAHKDTKCSGKGKCDICTGLSKDSPRTGGGLATGRLTQTSQDQTSQDQTSFEDGTPAGAPAIPVASGRVTKAWPASSWLSRFAVAWSEKYQRLTYGNGTEDAKATGELADLLAALPPGERTAAEAMALTMIGEYLADESSGRVKARHPWKWFVADFNGLRVPTARVVDRATGPPRGQPSTATRSAFASVLGSQDP